MFCFAHKWRVSRDLDSPRPLPRWTRRHLARCPSCRAFHRHGQALADRLTDPASQPAATVSPALHESILRRCRQAAAPGAEKAATPGRFAARRPRLALAAAVALAVVAVAAVIYFSLPTGQTPEKIVSPTPPREGGDAQPIAVPGPADLSAGAEAVIDTVVRQPVEREIRLLGQDGRAAAEFLLACLPVEVQLTNDPPMR